MRNLKKMLSLVMALAMIASFMVVGASAAAFPDDKDIVNKDAVGTLVALGVIKGNEKGEFNPKGIVTRAEMAKMICVALNGGNDPKLGNTVSKFTDVPATHWASGYIDFCTNMGILAGKGNNKFEPDATVTGTEAAKMLLILIGYDAANSNLTGAQWDVNTNAQANLRGFYADLAINPSQGLTRDNAAQMIFNAIQATVAKYEYKLTTVNGQLTTLPVVVDGTGNILSNKFKTHTTAPEGILNSFTYNSTTKKYSYAVSGLSTLTTKDDFTALMGQKVRIIAKIDNSVIYGMFGIDSTVMASGYVGNIGALDATNKTLKVSGTAYDVASTTIPVVYYKTGASVGTLTAVQAAAASATTPYSFKLIDNTGDSKADTMVIVPFAVSKVTYVGTDNLTVAPLSNVKMADVNVYEGVAKNDYVLVTAADYANEGKATVVKAEITSGKITGTKSGEYMIDGTWFTNKSGTGLVVNDAIEYIAIGGVVYYAKVTEGSVNSKDLALVITGGDKTGVTTVDSTVHQAKLLFADGTKKVVTTTVDYSTGGTNLVNKVVTYKINNDGEYTLTEVNNTTNKAGYDSYNATAPSGTGAKITTVGTAELADDAIVFVFKFAGTAATTANAGNDAKVITGKEAKELAHATYTGTQALIGKTNGFSYAKVASLIPNANTVNLPSTFTGAHYGYLVQDAYESSEGGKTYVNVTYWNGTADVTAKAEGSLTDALKAGAVITFDTVSSGVIKNVTVPAINTGAVAAWDESSKIQIQGQSSTKVDNDTTVLYINSAKKTGAAGGAISVADDTDDNGTVDVNNVRWIAGSGSLALLVVDVNNKIENAPARVLAASSTAANIASEFATGAVAIIINGDFAPVAAVTVPTGKTLTVNGNMTIAASEPPAVNGSLIVNGALTANETATVTELNGSIAAVANSKTLTVNGGKFTLGVATVGSVVLGAKAVMTVTADITMGGALMGTPVAGATVIVNTGKTMTVANTMFYTAAGSAPTNAPTNNNGVAGTGTTSATAGTYVAGTVYTNTTGTTAIAFVKQ
ncbi:MAG: S-layer homology domain-containing protein [Clostridia bacterium]|nr:S-layer homology domain-containing protein [Clostridia bacterium]